MALLNAGNLFMVNGDRVPNAALINFAQRANLVRDMLDGTAEQKLADARNYWRTVAESFASANDFMPENIVRDARPGEDFAPRKIVEIPRKTSADTRRTCPAA